MTCDIICPMFNEPCRHCSIHTTTHPYTRLKKNEKGNYFDSAGLGKTTEIIGEFCNNDGTKLVQDMHYCPARWGLHRGIVPEAPKAKRGRPKGVKPKTVVVKKKLGKTKQTKKVGRPKKNDTRKIREKAVRTVHKKAQRVATVPVARPEKRKYTRRTGT